MIFVVMKAERDARARIPWRLDEAISVEVTPGNEAYKDQYTTAMEMVPLFSYERRCVFESKAISWRCAGFERQDAP
jgi:hypothetical protein